MASALIITDLEGVSNVSNMQMVIDETSNGYKLATERLMKETNVAVSALFDSGADKVYVVDGHASGKNFIKGMLDSRAVQLPTWELTPYMNEIDAFVMIGTHAMAKTENAFFDHTQLWEAIKGWYYNGIKVGETAQMGVYAGVYNVPCVAASGDKAACEEAKSFYNGLETAVVKIANSRDSATCFSEEEALNSIYNAVSKGYKKRGQIKPIKMELPLTITIEYVSEEDCKYDCRNVKNAKFLNEYTVQVVKEKIVDYLDIMIY
ncbi:MAG: M55 family metallopeptidase [Clostridia bacterium]|nr:M55 family metallopeptidase [Clostridia bacterium]